MDYTVHGVANSQTRLNTFPFHGFAAPVHIGGSGSQLPWLSVFSGDRLVTTGITPLEVRWEHQLR